MSSALWPNHLHHKKRYVILDIFFQRIFFSEETQIQPRNQLKLTSNSSYGGIAIDKRQSSISWVTNFALSWIILLLSCFYYTFYPGETDRFQLR